MDMIAPAKIEAIVAKTWELIDLKQRYCDEGKHGEEKDITKRIRKQAKMTESDSYWTTLKIMHL